MNFGQLFDQQAAFVFRSLRHLGVREADVSDCLQEVFLVAYDKRDQLRSMSGARSWLYRIAYFVARNHLRRAHVRREVPVELVPAADAAAAADPVERAQLRADLQVALEALDWDKRAVLVAHGIEGLSVREIAEALEVPIKTVYSRLYAARSRAQEALAEVASRRQGGAHV